MSRSHEEREREEAKPRKWRLEELGCWRRKIEMERGAAEIEMGKWERKM